MAKILLAVHAYPPHGAGGSEYNAQRIAECLVQYDKADVIVLTNRGGYELNGVQVVSDFNILSEPWDVIVVHGDMSIQNVVLANAQHLKNIFYMLIRPREDPVIHHGMKHARWIGCGTQNDVDFATKHGHADKIRKFRYGVNKFGKKPKKDMRAELGITTPYLFVSTGGWYPGKRFQELINVFEQTQRDDVTLALTGYSKEYTLPKFTAKNIMCFEVPDPNDILELYKAADLYICNSTQEGFGLGIIEAGSCQCQWIAHESVPAAQEHKQAGTLYTTDEELKTLLQTFIPDEYKKGATWRWTFSHAHILMTTVVICNALEE